MTHHWRNSILVTTAALSLSACDRESAETLLGAVSRTELFTFNHVMLQPDSLGNYELSLDTGLGCQDITLTDNALVRLLENKVLTVAREVGGGEVVSQLPFTWEMLSECTSGSVVRFETDDLSQAVVDGDGNVTGRERVEGSFGEDVVDVDLSPDGQLDVDVFDIRISGQTDTQSQQPGPMDILLVEIPGDQIGQAASLVFDVDNAIPGFKEAELLAVEDNPRRVVVSFAFLAKPDPSVDEALLVWNGEIVMQTDL